MREKIIKKQMKTNKGITLIALVITIIVLLILAGVTISQLGERVLFELAKDAQTKTLEAKALEEIRLLVYETLVENEGKMTLKQFVQKLADDTENTYIVETNNKIASLVSKDGVGITDVNQITDETEAICVTNMKYGYPVGVTSTFDVKLEERENTPSHKITKNFGEGIIIDNTAGKVEYDKPYQATITTEGNYVLESLEVTMGGENVTVDVTTGIINIERVTGDIEITATSKLIEIEYTTVTISTSNSASNTSSLGANTQTKGTTLYINIIAKIDDTTCTVISKNDESKTVPYAITSNGKYIFIVTGTYNGRTIREEKEVEVNQYKSAVGLVQYDAGEWTKEEIEALQSLYNINTSKTASTTTGLNFTFGGFTYSGDTTNASYINDGTVITSRNQSVAPASGAGTPSYDGWQILESEEKNGKTYVTKIIHAGSPENFVYSYGSDNDAYRAEYILSSGLRQTGFNTYKPRSWDMYKDKKQLNLIEEVYVITYAEVQAIAGGTSGIRKTGAHYWQASALRWDTLQAVTYDAYFSSLRGGCYGVRPVVSLKSGVYIQSGTGVSGDPYVLGIE